MKPYYKDAYVTIYNDDCRNQLRYISEKYCEIAAKKMQQEVLPL